MSSTHDFTWFAELAAKDTGSIWDQLPPVGQQALLEQFIQRNPRQSSTWNEMMAQNWARHRILLNAIDEWWELSRDNPEAPRTELYEQVQQAYRDAQEKYDTHGHECWDMMYSGEGVDHVVPPIIIVWIFERIVMDQDSFNEMLGA